MEAMAKMVTMAMTFVVFVVMVGNVAGDQMGYARKARFLAGEPAPSPSSRTGSCSAHKHVCKLNDIPGEVKSRCCKDTCYNVLTNRYHCGSCGTYCPFGYGCCNGKCVNVAYDKNNCGSCGVQCSDKGKCVYGMCSYA